LPILKEKLKPLFLPGAKMQKITYDEKHPGAVPPLACIHTHTIFCDGADDIETCCIMAYKKGLSSLGFSAHAPVTKKTGFRTNWHIADEKFPEYIEAVLDAKKRWEGKLPVYLGLEIDFISGLMGPADRDYREMGLDFIIAAVHYVFPQKGEPFTVDDSAERVERGIKESFDGDPAGMVEAYLNSCEAMIRAGGFDLLAHPDVVKKNNSGNRFFSEEEDYYRKKTALLAELMAGTGVPAEVNTGGMNRGKIRDCYPSHDFLKLFRKYGVPMIINADAHRAEDLGGFYGEARQAMLRAGYTETALFSGRQNGRAIWTTEKL
jgi:histidinol-phosphatase (PHP family)